jgi:predicted Zn-dependent protease
LTGGGTASTSGNNSGTECQHCNLLNNAATTNTQQQSSKLQVTRKQQQQLQQQQQQTLKQQQQQQQAILDELMTLMRELGTALCALKQYECETALNHLTQLPLNQLQSPLCLSLKAKCHFELHQYALAETNYALLHRLYPYHLDGIEYYSTTLWHLHKVH